MRSPAAAASSHFPRYSFPAFRLWAANATNTLALWVGVTASGGAYRKHLNISRRVMIPLIVTSIVGGLVGAVLLIMNLAMLAAIGMTDMHAMNALKVVLGGFINGVATFTFIVTGAIVWRQGMIMTAGAILGGYFAAHYAQKVPQSWIRWFVILVGFAMTLYFFVRAYV